MHKYLLTILLVTLVLVSITTSYAQTRPRQTATRPVTPMPDLLVRRDGTQLDVLVTEITDNEIVYKRANNPNGPIFRVQKADFSFIKYGNNGEIERFAKVEEPAPAPVQPVPTPAQVVQTRPTSNASAPAYQSRQPSSPKNFRLGLLAGGQSATISSDGSTEGANNIFGFRGGLVSDRSIGNAGSFRTQILYSSKGTGISNLNLNVNYLEIPFDFLYKIQTPGAQFLLGGGGYFGTLLNAKLGSADAAKIFTTTDAGVRVSGWVDLSSGLTLNVFYNLGLLDINSGVSSSPIWKNKTLGFGVGYFLFKK